jgi:hypothetical protein
MTHRIARKGHPCEAHRFALVCGETPLCDGTIRAGQKYVEMPEHGEPFHPARYCLTCFRAEFPELHRGPVTESR